MKVDLLKTVAKCQTKVGSIMWDGKQLRTAGVGDVAAQRLLQGVDRQDAAAVAAALRRADQVYDGSYLRARVQEDAAKSYPNLPDAPHRGRRGRRGGSAPRAASGGQVEKYVEGWDGPELQAAAVWTIGDEPPAWFTQALKKRDRKIYFALDPYGRRIVAGIGCADHDEMLYELPDRVLADDFYVRGRIKSKYIELRSPLSLLGVGGDSAVHFARRRREEYLALPSLADLGIDKDELIYLSEDSGTLQELLAQREAVGVKEKHSGVMVALSLPIEVGRRLLAQAAAADVNVPKFLPVEELHVSLAILGEVREQSVPRELVLYAMQQVAARWSPVVGAVNGEGRFLTNEGAGQVPLVLFYDSPILPALRADAVQAIVSIGGQIATDHGFTPHITLGYMPADAALPEHVLSAPLPLTLDELTLAWGDNVTHIPFTGSAAASSAKALAWAVEQLDDATADAVMAALKSYPNLPNAPHLGLPGHHGGSAPRGGSRPKIAVRDIVPQPVVDRIDESDFSLDEDDIAQMREIFEADRAQDPEGYGRLSAAGLGFVADAAETLSGTFRDLTVDDLATMWDLDVDDDAPAGTEVKPPREFLEQMLADIQAGRPIKVYRTSEDGRIGPGAWVWLDPAYAENYHEHWTNGGKIGAAMIDPDELFPVNQHGWPECIYIPRVKEGKEQAPVRDARVKRREIEDAISASYHHEVLLGAVVERHERDLEHIKTNLDYFLNKRNHPDPERLAQVINETRQEYAKRLAVVEDAKRKVAENEAARSDLYNQARVMDAEIAKQKRKAKTAATKSYPAPHLSSVKHYGPGAHESGSPQSVHSGLGGNGPAKGDKVIVKAPDGSEQSFSVRQATGGEYEIVAEAPDPTGRKLRVPRWSVVKRGSRRYYEPDILKSLEPIVNHLWRLHDGYPLHPAAEQALGRALLAQYPPRTMTTPDLERFVGRLPDGYYKVRLTAQLAKRQAGAAKSYPNLPGAPHLGLLGHHGGSSPRMPGGVKPQMYGGGGVKYETGEEYPTGEFFSQHTQAHENEFYIARFGEKLPDEILHPYEYSEGEKIIVTPTEIRAARSLREHEYFYDLEDESKVPPGTRGARVDINAETGVLEAWTFDLIEYLHERDLVGLPKDSKERDAAAYDVLIKIAPRLISAGFAPEQRVLFISDVRGQDGRRKEIETTLGDLAGYKQKSYPNLPGAPHRGRPDQVGGSLPREGGEAAEPAKGDDSTIAAWAAKPVAERIEAWSAADAATQDRVADAKRTIPQEIAERLAFAGARPKLTTYRQAIAKRLQQIGDFIPADSAVSIREHLSLVADLLAETGADKAAAHELLMAAVDALAVQENESLSRQIGDHGVNHIFGDMDIGLQILALHPEHDTPQQEAAIAIAAIFHDTGYLTPPAKFFLDHGHERWSAEHFDANLGDVVARAFNADTAGRIGQMIRTHADSEIDWSDPPLSALRVADNLALFHEEKLPGLFRYVPANLPVLYSLGKGNIDLATAQGQMRANVNKPALHLSQPVRAALLRAVDEVSAKTPRKTLGMIAGTIDKLDWAGDHLHVQLRRNERAKILQRHLDLGQAQFTKFAKSYHLDPAQFDKESHFTLRRGERIVMEADIVGAALKAILEALMGTGMEDSLLLAVGAKADDSGWPDFVTQVPPAHLAGVKFVATAEGGEAFYHAGQKAIIFDPEGDVNSVARALGQHVYAVLAGPKTKAVAEQAFGNWTGDMAGEEVLSPADLFADAYELGVYAKATEDLEPWEAFAAESPALAANIAQNLGLKHYGPGAHESGSDQSVHGGGGGGSATRMPGGVKPQMYGGAGVNYGRETLAAPKTGDSRYPATQKRSLREIGREIRKTWPKVWFGAEPYVRALSELDSIEDDYGQDTADYVVRGFLGNASTWRGEDAKRIKTELKLMIGMKALDDDDDLSDAALAAFAKGYKHGGPGNHVTTGTPQKVHGGGGKGKTKTGAGAAAKPAGAAGGISLDEQMAALRRGEEEWRVAHEGDQRIQRELREKYDTQGSSGALRRTNAFRESFKDPLDGKWVEVRESHSDPFGVAQRRGRDLDRSEADGLLTAIGKQLGGDGFKPTGNTGAVWETDALRATVIYRPSRARGVQKFTGFVLRIEPKGAAGAKALAAVLAGGDLGDAALTAFMAGLKHYGPGPHPDGSPQSVHGGAGRGGASAQAVASPEEDRTMAEQVAKMLRKQPLAKRRAAWNAFAQGERDALAATGVDFGELGAAGKLRQQLHAAETADNEDASPAERKRARTTAARARRGLQADQPAALRRTLTEFESTLKRDDLSPKTRAGLRRDVADIKRQLGKKALAAAIVDVGLPDAALSAFVAGTKGWEENLQDGDFLVIGPDGERHLAITKTPGGKPKRSVCAAAWAALTSNHRGQPYQGPDKGKALAKLKDIYASQGWPLPGSEESSHGSVDMAAKSIADVVASTDLSDAALAAFTKACKPKRKKRKPAGAEPVAEAVKHSGPGDHPGTGTPQTVHGGGGRTAVGITSARPEKMEEARVFADMAGFEKELRAIKTLSNISVKPGRGGFDGGAEPTWVVSYRGNGEAKKLLARTGKQYTQDGVLLYEPVKDGDEAAPMFDFDFNDKLELDDIEGVERTLVGTRDAEGHAHIGGWSWYDRGDQKVLRMVYVKDWSYVSADEFTATVHATVTHLKKVFTRGRLKAGAAKVSIMAGEGDNAYDKYL